jgi:hypothetical protein
MFGSIGKTAEPIAFIGFALASARTEAQGDRDYNPGPPYLTCAASFAEWKGTGRFLGRVDRGGINLR